MNSKSLHAASFINMKSTMRFLIVNLAVLAAYVFSVRVFHLWDSFELMRLWFYGSAALIAGQLILFIVYKRFLGLLIYLAGGVLLVKLVIASGAIGYYSSISTGPSNRPTLHEDDLVIVKNFGLNYDRGVMVTVDIHGERYRKRIHGVPFDHIVICDGEVFVNGFTYQYVNQWIGAGFDNPSLCKREYRKLQLSESEFFVLGDNLYNSYDSRHFGAVQKDRILMNSLYVLKGNEPSRIMALTAHFRNPQSAD